MSVELLVQVTTSTCHQKCIAKHKPSFSGMNEKERGRERRLVDSAGLLMLMSMRLSSAAGMKNVREGARTPLASFFSL